jgi:hypothetical protein
MGNPDRTSKDFTMTEMWAVKIGLMRLQMRIRTDLIGN